MDIRISGNENYCTDVEVTAFLYERNGEWQENPVDIVTCNYSNQFNLGELVSSISQKAGVHWYKKFNNELCDIREIKVIYKQ